MKKMKLAVALLFILFAAASCGSHDADKTEEEIVIGDENVLKPDSSVQAQTVGTPLNAVSTKHPVAKIAEYDKKSKVNLMEVGKGDKGVSTRTKRYYYNESGTIVSLSEILHEDPKSDYVLFEKVGSANAILKLMITGKTKDATSFKGDHAVGTLSMGRLKIALDGEETNYVAAN